jgi:hypothetical protein
MSDSDIELGPILNIAHRLSPLIIISFFTLSTCFNGLANGVVFLIGAMIVCGLITGGGIGLANSVPSNFISKNQMCYIVNLTGKERYLSLFPINLSLLCYTFIYLLYPIATYDLVPSYLGIVIMFPILILAEVGWLLKNECIHIGFIFVTITLSLLMTSIYCVLIDNNADTVPKSGINLFYSIGNLNKKCTRKQLEKHKP